MAMLSVGAVNLHYEVHGDGFPLLLIAPGGMRSAMSFWDKMPWNPVSVLAQHYQVIAMDQRNAGESTAPVTASDGWADYTADQLRLLDHLGVDRFHVLGMCIGGSYGLGLIEAAPARVCSAVLLQPIGLDDNREAFYEMFDAWAAAVRVQQPAVPAPAWTALREAMFGGDFVFNVDQAFVRACRTPLLIAAGDDLYHPRSTSLQLAELAPKADLVVDWKEPEHTLDFEQRVLHFLARATP